MARPSTPNANQPARRGRWWFVLAAVFVGVLGLGLGVFVGLPGLVERAATQAIRRLENRFGVEVRAGHVDWTWGGLVTVSDFRVSAGGEPLMSAPRLELELDVAPWERRVAAVALFIESPTFRVRRERNGRLNIDSVLARLRAGDGVPGSASSIRIDTTPPRIAMERAAVEVDAKLPALPFGLTIPERFALRQGTITIVPRAPALTAGADAAPNPSFSIEARFGDTTLDPGYGLELSAVISKSAGPERLAASVTRPIRFFLGQRVVGFGGVAWSPARADDGGSLELSSLQLSVPIGATHDGVVAAAASCERVTIRPEPLTLLARVGPEPTPTKLLAAADTIELERPIVAVEVDALGHHSFEDLLRADPHLSFAGNDEAKRAGDPSLAHAAISASIAASDRLLLASGDAATESVAARIAQKFEALVRSSETHVPKVARLLDKVFMDSVAVLRGELIIDVPGRHVDVRALDAKATLEGGAKRVSASFEVDGEGATGKVAISAELSVESRLTISARGSEVPIAWLPERLRAAAHVLPDGLVTSFDVRFEGPATGRAWDLTGQVEVNDMVFHHASVARDPLRDLDLAWKGRVSFDAESSRLSVADTRVRSKDLALVLDADIADGRRVPRIHVGLELPETPVQTVVDALPVAFRPLLVGLRVDGSLRWSVGIDLDSARPADIVLRSEPVLTNFAVVSYGEALDFADLRGAHSYAIRLGDGTPGTRLVGPMTGSWVPFERVTPYLPAALTTTEDGTFWSNDGISTFAMRESLATNLARGSFVRGASTITQQLVKNLYLGGEKTLSRKLQELFIAWQMTKVLTKSEIMALYLNTIEFAPGIYGIGDAAWYYFGKRPYELDLTEAIYLASIIPGPRRYHYFFEQGRVTDRWRSYLQSLLNVMLDRGKITREELDAAAPYDPHFRGSDRPPPGLDEEEPPPDWDTPPEDHDEPQ